MNAAPPAKPPAARRRRGATLVELAIVLPLVFLFFLAAFEVSRIHTLRHTAENAAYEGARRGALPGARPGDVRQAANQLMRVVSARGVQIDVDPPVLEGASQVTVTVRVPIRGNSWTAPLFFRDRTVAGTCTLTRELGEWP